MSPSPWKKLSELAGNLSPSREKAPKAERRVASPTNGKGLSGYGSSIRLPNRRVASPTNDNGLSGYRNSPRLPRRESSDQFPRDMWPYHEIGRHISDPTDDGTMPPVISNATFYMTSDPDEPNANVYSRTYQPRVGFDTSENKNVTDFSFTMSSKHKNYKSTARSRTFLCGTDENDYSEFALEWLLEELVNEDDEIVCLRVVNPDTKTDVDASVLQETYKDEAKRLLDHFQKKNEDGIAISWVVELAVGKVEETIQAMVSTSTQVAFTKANDL